MYVRTYILFTSPRIGRFNWVWWLQASRDLTVELVEVSKPGVDCFFRNIGKGLWKIKGVMRKKKKSGVFLSSLYLATSLLLCLSLYLCLCPIHYIYLLSLSIYLSLSISQKIILKKNGPPISTAYRSIQEDHRDDQPYGTWRYCQGFGGGCMPQPSSWYQWGFCVFLASKEDAPMADVVSVGTIGAVDILGSGPSGDTWDEKICDLSGPSLDMRRIVERSRV